MNAIDYLVLFVFAIAILGGFYHGFVNALLNLFATIIAMIAALLFSPLLSSSVKNHQDLYSMLLYYTEGSEYVAATDVELTRVPVSQISSEQLKQVINNADMPIPMGDRISRNVASEVFSGQGITTLGDYFNQTIVCTVINIFSVLVIFAGVLIILSLVIRGVEYGRDGFPSLMHGDGLIGAGVGLLQGILVLFAMFLLVPVILTVLPKLGTYFNESLLGNFFYRANFLLRMISGT